MHCSKTTEQVSEKLQDTFILASFFRIPECQNQLQNTLHTFLHSKNSVTKLFAVKQCKTLIYD